MTCKRGCCDSQAEHYRSLVLSGAPSQRAVEVKREDADLAAYKRLRQEGHQPPSHVGAAALEKAAHTPAEIETGRLIRNRRLAEQAQKAHDIAKDPETFVPLSSA